MELMVETTQSIIDHRGEANLPLLLEAARGRCTAAHFGTYDYTASCQITAAHQHMLHPACDFAKHMMQIAFAGTGVWLSDGATNIMPVAVHRAAEGQTLTEEQTEENRAAVQRAWALHFSHVRNSLTNAFYQGWDLHPAQLPTRYAAVYSFFLESLAAASERLTTSSRKRRRPHSSATCSTTRPRPGPPQLFLRAITAALSPSARRRSDKPDARRTRTVSVVL